MALLQLPVVLLRFSWRTMSVLLQNCETKEHEMTKDPKRLTPMRAIKAFCKECVGGTHHVHDCGGENNCVLFPFRRGHNPARKGIGRKGGPAPKIGTEKVR